MDATAVIAALGGPQAVAERFGVSRTAPYNWRRDGIPSRLWLDVIAALEASGKDVPVEAVRWRPGINHHVREHDTLAGMDHRHSRVTHTKDAVGGA